jgi:ubiquitin-protein ligase E3 C
MEPKLHFLANITTFAAPRYPKFAASILDAYLTLLTTLMNGIPPGIAKAKQTGNTTIEQPMDVDSDDEEVSRPLPRAITSHPSPPFNLDTRTVTRLKSIVSSSHLQGLMSASYQKSTDRRTLIVFTLALSNTWPSHRNQIWDAVSLSSGQRFVREIYRQFVRASPLGKPDTAGAATGLYNSSSSFAYLINVQRCQHV